MTAHAVSGYISRLWQALFAPLMALIARVFRFTSSADANTSQAPDPPPPSVPAGFDHGKTKNQNTLPSQQDPNQTQSWSQYPDQQGNSRDSQLGLMPPAASDDTMAPYKQRVGRDHDAFKHPRSGSTMSRTASAQQLSPAQAVPGVLANNPFSALATMTNTEQVLKSDSQQGRGNNQGLAAFAKHPLGPQSQYSGDTKENGVRPLPAGGSLASQNSTQSLSAQPSSQVNVTGPQELRDPTSTIDVGELVPHRKFTTAELVFNSRIIDTTEAVDKSALHEGPALSGEGYTKELAAVDGAAVPTTPILAVPSHMKSLLQKPATITPTPTSQVLPGLIEPRTNEEKAEREYHLSYMREALAMGQLALNTNETPVGCVLVYNGKIVAKGMNATNVTRNGTRHAEFMAISALLSYTACERSDEAAAAEEPSWESVDPKHGHLFPYGQKFHPAPRVSRSVVSECVLYVTVEPCVMCASLLRQLGIKKVYFGAVNDKFGGTGGVFRIHINSKPAPRPEGRPYQNGYGPMEVSRIARGRTSVLPRDDKDGDGGNVEPGFPAEGGYLRDEAVSLLRRFYVQENGRAPQPRKKEGRAARLYAMENGGTGAGNSSDTSEPPVHPETPTDLDHSAAITPSRRTESGHVIEGSENIEITGV